MSRSWILVLLVLLVPDRGESGSLFGDENVVLTSPSEKFLSCHFNPLCFCKYTERTEIYDFLQSLWQLSQFNETHFLKSLHKDTKYDRNDLNVLASGIVNSTFSSRFDPGPVFEFFCLKVPIATIPTDYSAHGVLSHVSVVGSPIKILDGSSFAGLEVQNIQLNKNELYFISEYAFSSMSNSLTVLDLSSNFLDEVPWVAFKTVAKLEWLNLSGNKIQTVEGDWFGLTSTLRQLTLSANSIQVLPPKLFPSFGRLIWLDLSQNFIRNLSNLPPHLQTLIVMKNPLSMFPLGVFHLRSLSWVVLSGCAIDKIPTEWPRGLGPTQINQLDLTQNFIQHWPRRPFGSSLKILDLDVSKNYMEQLPSASFHSMNSFRLSLAHNRIRTIDPNAFETLNTLQYLNLDNNRLDSVPWPALANLTSLHHLYLGNNLLHNSTLDPPPNYECKLTYLGLNGNGLTTLPGRLLSSCPLLLHLNLGYNQIGNLFDFVAQKKLKNLSTLILRNNPIYTLAYEDKDKFQNSNEITVIPKSESGEKIPNIFRLEAFPNLYELSLSFCQLSGELEPFPPLLLTNLEISNGLKSATTINADSFQSLRHLELIALDHNQINTISDYAFYSNKNLSYVNLEFNKISSLQVQIFHPDIHHAIREVRLGHNKITTLFQDSFLSFPAINLDLSHNLITTIERHAFNMAKTSSQVITEENAEGLNLYLRNNRVTFIKSGAFSQEKFALVDLSHNLLQHFNFDAFSRKTTLGGLNISYNSVDRISSHNNLRFVIKYLDASHNRINYKGVNLENICPTQLLDLSYNRIDKVDLHLFPVNCSIKEVNLNSNLISSIDPDSFTQLRDLTVLQLQGNLIWYVPEIVFIRNQKLSSLDLSENRIRSLPRDSLVGSNIEILNLRANQFVNLPVGALSRISRRLKILHLGQNAIEHLDSTMFEPLPGIVSLNVSSNRLNILPDNAFANLASLRELDLSHNFLRANFKELFHFLPKLKVLRLCGCGIKSVPFLPLPHLMVLSLAGNGVEEFSSSSLGSLTRLRHLDLTDNLLTNNRLPNWSPLKALTELKLSKNPLRSVTRDTFFGLSRLESLEIVDLDRIERFDSDVLSYLTNLKTLSVETYPNIEKYRFRLGAVLSGIDSLEELRVQIKETTLSDQLFGGILPKLRKLRITGSNLRRIEPLAFEGLQNCLHMELTITNTQIEDIPSRLLKLLLNADWARLDLSHNNISSLNSNSLYPNSSIWFSKGTKLLQGGLVLDGNEWICDCNLVWVGEWLRRWLRESFESHSATVPEVQKMYEIISTPTCLDSRYSTSTAIPLVQLYPDHICHASALSKANPVLTLLPLNFFLIISTFLLS